VKFWAAYGVVCTVLLAAYLSVPFFYDRSGPPAAGSVRRAALASKIRGLDPQDIGDTTSAAVAGQIFETLYTYSYLERPYRLIPLLAADLPEVSPDGLALTLTIRPGIFFCDDPAFPGGQGRELTATDFIYAWMRMADLNNRSTNYAGIFQGYVKGLDEFRAASAAGPADYDGEIEGLEVLGRYTMRIKLNKPYPFLVYWLAHLPTAPVAREAVEFYGPELVNHPVGTGPYRLAGDFRSNRFSLERNKNYRLETYPARGEDGDARAGLLADAGRRIPFIDRIEWSVIEEPQPRWLAFLDGQLDASGIPRDNFSEAITPGRELAGELRERDIRLLKFDDPSVFYYGFNMNDPVVGSNLPLRRAMSLAFDRETYIERFLNGRGRIPVGPIPPSFPSFRPEKENPWVRYDPEEARRLLAQAEEECGGPLPLLRVAVPGTDTTTRQGGEFFRVQMERIGLSVEMDYMTWPRFQDANRTGSHQIFALGWQADYPDAENFLFLFYGPNRSPGPNACNFSDPEFDRLYEQAVVLPLLEDRLPSYHRMEDIVIEQCPWLLLTYRVNYVLIHPWLENYKPNNFAEGTIKYQAVNDERRRAFYAEKEEGS